MIYVNGVFDTGKFPETLACADDLTFFSGFLPYASPQQIIALNMFKIALTRIA